MSRTAIIGTGGCGDVLSAIQAATLIKKKIAKESMDLDDSDVDIYINSHKEVFDFVSQCTNFEAFQCPERQPILPDIENPLNLPLDFLDSLFANYEHVYSAFPDGMFYQPFSWPWYEYSKSYKSFLKTKVHLKTSYLEYSCINKNKKNIFLNFTCVNPEKCWSLQNVQKLVNLLNTTKYNIIIARTSNWKGTPIPFFCQGNFVDLVDQPIFDVVSIMNKCDIFAGLDSGCSHIAYHLGLPRIVLQRHYNAPFAQVRWSEDTSDDLPLDTQPEIVFNRIMLNLREPLTTAIPSYLNIPYNTNVKQLLVKKYYA